MDRNINKAAAKSKAAHISAVRVGLMVFSASTFPIFKLRHANFCTMLNPEEYQRSDVKERSTYRQRVLTPALTSKELTD